jgi:glycerophosphoryl diester phosphodiesterase
MNLLLDPSARPVIGHRGASAYAPENTLESFRQALRLGAEALEFDIRASANGVPMVFHDEILDRTTDLLGPIGEYTTDALAKADAGYRFSDGAGGFPYRGAGVRIPTLQSVVEEFSGVPLLIELKEVDVQDAVARVLLERGAAEHAVLAGLDWRALRAFALKEFHRGASRLDIARLYIRLGSPHRACRCYAVPERYHGLQVPSPRFVRAAHARQSTVHVWTVDEAETARALWANGVNGIITNRPDLILAARTP